MECRQQAPQQRRARLPDRKPQAGGSEPVRCAQLRKQEREPLVVVAAPCGRAPVVDAGADDAHGASEPIELGAKRVGIGVCGVGERAPQLAELHLDDVCDAVRDDPCGDLGRRALGGDHLGSPVEGARGESPARRQRWRFVSLRSLSDPRVRQTAGSGRRHPARARSRRGTAARAGRLDRRAGTG